MLDPIAIIELADDTTVETKWSTGPQETVSRIAVWDWYEKSPENDESYLECHTNNGDVWVATEDVNEIIDLREDPRYTQGFTDPLESSPFETPDGWIGGRVRNTGGHIYLREWTTENMRSEDAAAGDVGYKIQYAADKPGVALEAYTFDRDLERFTHSHTPVVRGTDTIDDKPSAKIAKILLEDFNDRALDLEAYPETTTQ